MTVLSEIVIGDEDRLVATAEPVEVGDALIVDDEILLVLRESERAAVRAQARFQCRRALMLKGQATELLAHGKSFS